MLKKVIEYQDFNNDDQIETLYFNLTEAEVLRLDLEFEGGLESYVLNLNEVSAPRDILRLFEKILLTSYGVKSEDGRRFIKTDEATAMFKDSAAYSALFVELLSDTDAAASFFNDILSVTALQKAGILKNQQEHKN